MASLLDTIQRKLEPTAPKVQLGQTEQIRTLARAKTGREITPSTGPRQTALGERIAARQAELGAEQLRPAQQIKLGQQAKQVADIEQREELGQRQEQQRTAEMKAKFDNQMEQVLHQYASGQRQLRTMEDIANIETVGANLRLENKQYIHALQTEGQKMRLDNKLNFMANLASSQFSAQRDVLEGKIALDLIVNASDRKWDEEMKALDINTLIEIAEVEGEGEAARAEAEAKGGLVSSVIEGGAQVLDWILE